MALAGSMSFGQNREQVFSALGRSCEAVYGERLMTVAIFGSAGRGTARPDSDLDLLLVADPLPNGRIRRIDEFAAVEKHFGGLLTPEAGAAPLLSPVLKTPEEVGHGSPLFLDMTEDARILFDRGSFFALELDRLRVRLASLGSRRVWLGNAWYWDLKPDYRPGEVFDL